MADGGGPVPSGLGRTVRSAPTAGGGHPTPDDYHPPPPGQAAEEAHVRSTCKATDLRRGSFVIHIVDGVLMDFEFEQSMSQERAPANSEDSDLAGEHEGEQEQKEVPK